MIESSARTRTEDPMQRTVFLIIGFAAFLRAQNTAIPNNVAPWVAQAQKTGHANPNSRVLVTVYLKPSNEAGLRTLVRNLYTKGSPQYHQFLSPADFRADYA